MKLDKAVLFGAGLFTYAVCAGTGAGLSNRIRYPPRVEAFNTTREGSAQDLTSRHSADPTTSRPPLTKDFADAFVTSSSTTTPSQISSPKSVSASRKPPSQQKARPTNPDSWSSDSIGSKTRTRRRTEVSVESPSLPPTSRLSNATTNGSSASNGPASIQRQIPSGKVSSGEHETTANGTDSPIATESKARCSSSHGLAANRTISRTGTLPPPKTPRHTKAWATLTVDCPIDGQKCYTLGGEGWRNVSRSTTTTTRRCTPFYNEFQPMTVYSIVHTMTVTFYGRRTDYTPPYKTIQTPEYCSQSASETEVSSKHGFLPPITQDPIDTLGGSHITYWNPLTTLTPFARPKVTFITTDKNPSVVFPSDPPPDYDATWTDPYPSPLVHKTVPPDRQGHTPDAEHKPPPTFRITAKGNEVTINTGTFSSLQPDQTITVTVDGGKFTIYPTAVVGEGGSVAKPPPAPTYVGAASSTKGRAGGLDISVSGSQAVIGGVTMTIPPQSTTTNIQGQSVTVNAGKIIVGPDSFTFNPSHAPSESDVVIAGGEMLTAVGKSVVIVHSKTITYGPSMSGTTEVINGDTITIGPSGVIVHGMLLGGSSANATDTKYEIIGGATITKIAPSIAIINGKTFTVGPDAHLTTTMIAGQEFTIGPTGVIVSTITMTYPFGPSVVTTFSPTGTWLNTMPTETGLSNNDDDSMGNFLRPSLPRGYTVLCIAIGVLVFA